MARSMLGKTICLCAGMNTAPFTDSSAKRVSGEIFYFTGTGNSLAAAKDLAGNTGAVLKAIKDTEAAETVSPEAESIGLVFPAYYMRMPGIVERFIGKLENLENKYIFAVVTVGGIAGDILDRLSALLTERGGALAAGFIIRMPANYIDSAGAMPLFLQRKMFRKWKKKAEQITAAVNARKQGIRETFNPLATFLFSGTIEKQLRSGDFSPDIDRHFHTGNGCTACSICTRICPVGNISMENGIPVWHGHCEKCLACIQWCPRQAIEFGTVTKNRKRYHHPEITLTDMY